jgi:hypothetical protein
MMRNVGFLALLAGVVASSCLAACSSPDPGRTSDSGRAGNSARVVGPAGSAGIGDTANVGGVGEGGEGTRGLAGFGGTLTSGGSGGSAGGTPAANTGAGGTRVGAGGSGTNAGGGVPNGAATARPTLSDVRFWARSDQGVTVNGNNDVTGWSSLDGTFGAATFSAHPPTREMAAELGNKPVIRFESSLEQWAGWAGLAIGTKGDFSITYVARVRHDPTQVNNEWYIVGNTGTTNGIIRGGAAFYGNWDESQPTAAYDGFDLRPDGGTGDFATRANDQWRVHTYTREAATSDVRYWVDGYEHTNDWASSNWQNPTESDSIVMIGAQLFALSSTGCQQAGNVVIAELIITSSNNVSSIVALHAAMLKEYGIPGIAP